LDGWGEGGQVNTQRSSKFTLCPRLNGTYIHTCIPLLTVLGRSAKGKYHKTVINFLDKMRELRVSAPGKVILHGEHAVVYGKTIIEHAVVYGTVR